MLAAVIHVCAMLADNATYQAQAQCQSWTDTNGLFCVTALVICLGALTERMLKAAALLHALVYTIWTDFTNHLT